MPSVTLSDFMAFNDELAALVRAGIPLSVEFASSPAHAESTLQRINAEIARQVSHGASIQQALEVPSETIPPSYRSFMLLALETQDLQTALTTSHRAAESLLETRRTLQMSLVYPAIVIGLAYLGLVSMCLFFVPVLESLYHSMQLPAGVGLKILLFLRDSLPYWVAVPPLVALFLIAARWIFPHKSSFAPARGQLAWLPGMRRALFLEACATFADSLATLLNIDTPFPEALVVAAQISGEPVLQAQAADLALRWQPGTATREDHLVGQRLPPFLRWALLHGGETTDQPRSLLAAARVYRESAQRRVERLRLAVPLLACVLIAGSVTLLYGLALFLPMVELLQGLA